jgi:hypothetical protein
MSSRWLVILMLLSMIVIFGGGGDCDFGPPGSLDDDPSPVIIDVTQQYPSDYATGISRNPHFFWYEVNEPERFSYLDFTVKLRYSGTDEWLQTVEVRSDTALIWPDTLDAETKYAWEVEVRTSSGDYTRSGISIFDTGSGFNNPPVEPFNVSPISNISWGPYIEPGTVFTWDCFDPDGDEITYDFYLQECDDEGTQLEDQRLVANDLTVEEFTPSIELGKNYWWVVNPFDEHGDSTAGRLYFCATVRKYPPDQPVALYPKDGGTGLPLVIVLRWSCSDPDGDALTYDVHMRKVGQPLVMIGHDLGDDFLDVGQLEYNAGYEWQVTAEDIDGRRTSGPVWSFTTEAAPDYPGIYAELMIHRSQYISKGIPPDPDQIIRLDHVYARFDSVFAPDGPVYPRQPAAVIYNVGADVPLWWVDASSRYYRDNPTNGWFLAPGYDYTFTVTEGDGVPALTKAIYYPECGPYLNSPDAYTNVSKDEFEVTWSGHDAFADCPAEVRIRVMDMGPLTWTDIDLMVPNTGSYTFTAGNLSVLDPMTYMIQVVLIIETKEYIVEPGYDPRSWAWARTHSSLMLYLQ